MKSITLTKRVSVLQVPMLLQILIVGGTAAYVVVTTMRFGAGITSDSVHYLASARSLMERGELATYTGLPLVSYAPGLPMIYALGYLLGLEDSTLVAVTNLLSLFAIGFVSKCWIDRLPITVWHKTAALAAIVWCPPLVRLLPYSLSEPPFIACTLGSMYCIWQFNRLRRKKWLLFGCLLASIAGLTRYIGISVVIAGGIFLSLYWPKRPQNFLFGSIFAFVSALPVLAWLLRNKLRSGTLFGVRADSDYTAGQLLSDTIRAVSSWVVPERLLDILTVIAILGILMGGLVAFMTFMSFFSVRRSENESLTMLPLVSLFIVSYSVLLVYSAATVKFASLNSRYWSPIAIPLVWLLVGLLPTLSQLYRLSGYLRRTIAMICVLWLISGVYEAGRTVVEGYPEWWTGMVNNSVWRSSELVGYIKRTQLNGVIYSNYPEHLYYLTGNVCYWLPYRGRIQFASEGGAKSLDEFLLQVRSDLLANKNVYIAYFSFPGRTYAYSPQELERHLHLSLVYRARDGEVFKVSALRTVR